MFCQKCGSQIPEGALSCPACGSAVVQSQPQAESQYQQAPPQYQQYNNPLIINKDKNAETANTLGIISIIAAFFIPLACWICAGIGISKANDVIAFAQAQNEMALLEKAKKGKKYCKIGLIISLIRFALAFIYCVFIFIFIVSR